MNGLFFFWVVAPILIPLAAVLFSCLMLLAKSSTPQRFLALATAPTTLAASIVLAYQVTGHGTLEYRLAGWDAPLGINLRADGLSAFMVLMSCVVGAFVTLYAVRYYFERHEREGRYFWVLWMFLWASLNSLFLSGDIFNLYVALEIMGLSAAALITLPQGRAALTAGMRYLLVSLLGSLAYLMGVALLYGAFGTLDIALLGELMAPAPAVWAAIALISLGMALKTGLFPLHFWLPPAYAGAPSPASALLAGLVGKASFYLLLRLWFDAFGGAIEPVAGQLLGILGGVAIVWGAVMALRQERLKMLLAYSSVSQVGYLFVVFSLGTAAGWGFDAWSGSVYHALSHACAKAAAFMSVGAIIYATGHDEIRRMEGIATRLPLAVAGFAVAGITLMGLPPSGGFTAKWLLVSAAMESGQWWLGAVLLVGGILSALYLLRFMNPALIHAPMEKPPFPPSRTMEAVALLLAVVALFLALLSAPLLELLRVGAPFPSQPVLGGT